ncbi:hypothetical protein Ahy_B05g074493 isoform F [Arachis hypogaea]|uniref:Uncharacterized protein n=1 Tax=Arachis hypogaea TaxID=3818 RepID=A0A444YZ15_ARAHY|nr:hypothetical protein Ahy_B05g074493 isoform F [Arachis hypogaea]
MGCIITKILTIHERATLFANKRLMVKDYFRVLFPINPGNQNTIISILTFPLDIFDSHGNGIFISQRLVSLSKLHYRFKLIKEKRIIKIHDLKFKKIKKKKPMLPILQTRLRFLHYSSSCSLIFI